MIAKADKNTVVKEKSKQKKSKLHSENGVALPEVKSSRLTKEQKKEIEAQADDESGAISEEVGQLLAHLKKEHSLPDDEPATGKKKNKAKKGKLTDVSDVSESDWQGTKSTEFGFVPDLSSPADRPVFPKKVNQKRKKHELDEKPDVNEIAESLSTSPKKKKKKSEAIQVAEPKLHVNKKNAVKNESVGSEASVAKNKGKKEQQKTQVEIAEANPVPKSEKKKKKKKGEARVQSEKLSAASLASSPKKQRKNSDHAESDEENDDEVSLSTQDNDNETNEEKPKTEYYLKNAFPIYVGNLPTNVKKKRILKMFRPCGEILALRLRTNIGKNFMKREQIKKVPFLVAFVYFATEKAAEDSLKLTGEKIGDNVIYVDRDLDKKDEKSKINAKTTVFIGNLKYQTTNADLQETFQCCGDIKYVRTIQCKLGCNGSAYVCFKKPESVDLALKLSKTLVLDREIRVERFHTKKLGGRKSKSKDDKSQLQGAALRVSHKLGKQSGEKSFAPNAKGKETKNDKKKKEFLGTKSNAKKKKFDPKKKVKVSAMKKLAGKIAPKSTA